MSEFDTLLTLTWRDDGGLRETTLGAEPGPIRVRLGLNETLALPLPGESVLLIERTTSGLWWVSATGSATASWSADGGRLIHPQALGQGSVLELDQLTIEVSVGQLGAQSGAPEQAPPDAPDGIREGPRGPAASSSGSSPPPTDDDRLMYNLTAPRDELLAEGWKPAPSPSTVDTPAPPDQAGQNAPTLDPMPPNTAQSSDPSGSASAHHGVDVDNGVSRTPATALPRAPGPDDVWMVRLEHRHGAHTDELTILQPPTTSSYLLVGRDVDCALPVTDAEVAPIQVGLQLQQDGVIVHPHPGTELPLVVDGRVARHSRPLGLGGILSFGRHALCIAESRVLRAADAPAHARVPRVAYRASKLASVWRIDATGSRQRTQQMIVQADLGRAPRMVIGSRPPADWVMPRLAPALERLEIDADEQGDLFVNPVGGRISVGGLPVVDRWPLRRGQAIVIDDVRLTLMEVDFRPATRPAWMPSAPSVAPSQWVVARQRPPHQGEVLVLDFRAKHPSGKEERVEIDAPLGWGDACITIGRDPECDLVVHDPTVSRQHAVIRYTGGGLSIRDHSGRGSLWVNNRPVEVDTALIKGDALTMGVVRLDLVGMAYRGPAQPSVRRRVRLTVALQVGGAEGPELYRVDRVIWSDRAAQLRLGAHPSSDVTIVGAPMSLGRLEVAQHGVVFVDGTGQGGRFYGGRSFERAVELVEGDAVEVGGVLIRFVGASVVELDP